MRKIFIGIICLYGFFITIPPFILLLFTLGLVLLIKRVLRRLFVINNNYENKDLWRGGSGIN